MVQNESDYVFISITYFLMGHLGYMVVEGLDRRLAPRRYWEIRIYSV